MRTPYVVLAARSALSSLAAAAALPEARPRPTPREARLRAGPDGIPPIENVGRLTAAHAGRGLRRPDPEAEAGREARGTLEGTEVAIDAGSADPRPHPGGRGPLGHPRGRLHDLAKAYYWLAHAHVRYEGDEARMLALYETGVACGWNAIAPERRVEPGHAL